MTATKLGKFRSTKMLHSTSRTKLFQTLRLRWAWGASTSLGLKISDHSGKLILTTWCSLSGVPEYLEVTNRSGDLESKFILHQSNSTHPKILHKPEPGTLGLFQDPPSTLK